MEIEESELREVTEEKTNILRQSKKRNNDEGVTLVSPSNTRDNFGELVKGKRIGSYRIRSWGITETT